MFTLPSSLGILGNPATRDNQAPVIRDINVDNAPNWTTQLDPHITDEDSNIDWATFQFEGTDFPLEDLITEDGTWTYDPTTHEITFIDNRPDSEVDF